MPKFVNVNGIWKPSKTSINVGGVWKNSSNEYVNINGVWKPYGAMNYRELFHIFYLDTSNNQVIINDDSIELKKIGNSYLLRIPSGKYVNQQNQTRKIEIMYKKQGVWTGNARVLATGYLRNNGTSQLLASSRMVWDLHLSSCRPDLTVITRHYQGGRDCAEGVSGTPISIDRTEVQVNGDVNNYWFHFSVYYKYWNQTNAPQDIWSEFTIDALQLGTTPLVP